MSAVLGSIILSPAAGMSPLRAAAVVVSDGGGEIVASPRRPQVDEEDLNRNQRHDAERFLQTVRSATLCGQRVGIIHHQAAYRLALQGQSLRSTAGLATDQNPAKTDVQSASGFFAPTPVSPDCRTNLR